MYVRIFGSVSETDFPIHGYINWLTKLTPRRSRVMGVMAIKNCHSSLCSAFPFTSHYTSFVTMAGNMTRMRTQGPFPVSYASRTLILDPTETSEQGEDSVESGSESTSSVGILRLRGDVSARTPRKIKWDDKVVDNEGMGKKKSKGM